MSDSIKTKFIIEKTKYIFIISLCLFFITLFSSFCFAQDEIIKVDTDLIIVPVTVFDREGRYITNLKKEDFEVFENGLQEKIDFFESVSEPIAVLLLIDISGSMTSHLTELNSAANTFVNQLRSKDQVMIATFADDVYKVFDFTEVNRLKGNFKLKQRRVSQTRIYDAVDYSLNKIKKIKGRKAIIVFSDGAGDGIFASFKDNMKKAEEGESIIYTVQFDTFPKTPTYTSNKKRFYRTIKIANTYMQMLPAFTGGRAYKLENISNLRNAFAQIANELGQQYSIGYYPKTQGKKGERRQIKVKVNIPNVAVRARESYIVGSDKD